MRDILNLAAFMVLVPLAGLLFAGTPGRVAFFLFGLALLSIDFFVKFGGHNPFFIIPFFGYCLALAALLAELLVRGARLVRKRRMNPEDVERPQDR